MEKTLSSKILYTGRAVKLRLDSVEKPGGSKTTREIIEHADCVTIIPVDAAGNILLVKQFRKAVEKDLLEIPAGSIEHGESPEEAVIRELREETGFKPGKVDSLGGFYSTPGYTTEYLYLYLATVLIRAPLMAEDSAEIAVVPTPSGQITKLIASGEIEDAKSIAGLLKYLCGKDTKS